MVSINRWPLLLGGLFLAFLLFTFWSVRQAISLVSPVSDPDYYQSGQRYHEDERAWRAAAEAGWQALLSREGEVLRLRLLDGDGEAVSGSTVDIKQAGILGGTPTSWQVSLPEVAPGIYQASAAELPAGPGELILAAAKGEARLLRRFQVNAPHWKETRLR